MIAARQIAFGKAAGGNKLPDGVVPIEYLESTTTQWIDTGVMFTDRARTYRFEITAQSINANNNYYRWFCGFYVPLNEDSSVATNYDAGAYGDNTPQYKFYPGVGTTYYQNGVAIKVPLQNGEKYEPVTAVWEKSDVNIQQSFPLFTRKIATGGMAEIAPMRIFSCKVYEDGTLILDLIPVRKGNIGYMYDKVSGQLFGNAGTGEFVLGPDIIDYTAKDYVQNGLVGFYDSIENLGPGLSDDSGSFKEWVSGYIASSLKGIVFDSSHTPGVMDALAGTGKTIEICVKNVAFDSTSSLQRNLITTSSVGQTSFQIKKSSVRFAYVLLDGTDFPTVPLSDFFSATFSITRNESAINFAKNGSIVKSKENSSTPSSFTRFETMKDDSVVTYELCRVSIYSRALTAEEIAHNYSIDKARFGL